MSRLHMDLSQVFGLRDKLANPMSDCNGQLAMHSNDRLSLHCGIHLIDFWPVHNLSSLGAIGASSLHLVQC